MSDGYMKLDGETYFRIADSHKMADFFMTLVGASDHWMFISSSGALTAGRCDPDSALFPYATDDQLSAARSSTGPKTFVRVDGTDSLWEPFASHATAHKIRRNLYKTPLGNKLVFEEINDALQLAFRYRWAFSERFGFIRSCRLENLGEHARSLGLLDGLQNVLPYGVGSEFMMRFSNLSNAYKKSELVSESNIGLFYLSSIPTDRAEPSEGLKTTTVWQTGLRPHETFLSTDQVPAFRDATPVVTERDVRGKAGAFLVQHSLALQARQTLQWHVVAELSQDHADVLRLAEWLRETNDVASELEADIEVGQQRLLQIVSSSDGRQCGANERRANRHLSNTVFNVMRGGVPLEHYQVDTHDFRQHVMNFHRGVYKQHATRLEELPPKMNAADLRSQIDGAADRDLTRLVLEYLPLAFSRRHGDPTRPWNRFAIRLRSANGRTSLNYQGNWRDIFQNWEALAASFPNFSTAMICRFVNATTADGYNPYRVTKGGFEWEEPSPHDPWSNLGYWGDHQIIYLLKLLEWNRQVGPKELNSLLDSRVFTYANVPYRILDFDAIKQNPQKTIAFDATLSRKIADRVAEIGADGKLLRDRSDDIHRVSLLEKLLVLSLAKLSNFIPDGGIWLNTQRPEWNDANNALVGNGLSMVTTCYLARWFRFLRDWLADDAPTSFDVSPEVAEFCRCINAILNEHVGFLGEKTTPTRRLQIVDALSRAGSDYRNALYEHGVVGQTTELRREDCLGLFETALRHLESTIRNNRREDGLFHAYNLLDLHDDRIGVERLYEMLEGQVAVLSSGVLSAGECVTLLDALRASALYRENQRSYLLYPNRQLPRFLEKNCLTTEQVAASPLLQELLETGNEQIVCRDCHGGVHFSGALRNTNDLLAALDELPAQHRDAAEAETPRLTEVFLETFGHRQFTGRSGTFFAYEGLGSIYWHMVSKLGLAVAENFFNAVESGASDDTVAALREHYHAIRDGIGAEKTPAEYGAFPTDPYSHTPENAGVMQPGMTGQVKEDILSRFAELGVCVEDGCLRFRLDLFDRSELLNEPRNFSFYNVGGELQSISLPAGSFAFTLCQVPIIYRAGGDNAISVRYTNGQQQRMDGLRLNAETSQQLFSRSGEIDVMECHLESL